MIFTDEETQVSDVVNCAPLGKSDHSVITFKFQCYIDYSKPKERYVYAKADWKGMIEELVTEGWADNFIASLSGRLSEDVWMAVKSKLIILKEKFVPKAKITGKPSWNEKGSIPINETLQKAIRKTHAEHRHWIAKKKMGNADEARKVFTRARNKVSTLMRKATRAFEKSIARSSKINPKSFWAHVRRRMKTKSGVAPLLENKDDKNSLKF